MGKGRKNPWNSMDVQGTWDETFLINISLDIVFAEDIKWSIPFLFPASRSEF